MISAGADRACGMVHLNEIGILGEIVKLKLLLRSDEWHKMVERINLACAEYKLMVFEQSISMLIDVNLQGRVVGMGSQFIMVGECHDVISELAVGCIGFSGPVFTLIGRDGALHACVGMEICSFPAVGGVYFGIRIEYVGA